MPNTSGEGSYSRAQGQNSQYSETNENLSVVDDKDHYRHAQLIQQQLSNTTSEEDSEFISPGTSSHMGDSDSTDKKRTFVDEESNLVSRSRSHMTSTHSADISTESHGVEESYREESSKPSHTKHLSYQEDYYREQARA
jgi:hypothetical protein